MEGLISLSIFLKRQEVGLFIGKRGEFNYSRECCSTKAELTASGKMVTIITDAKLKHSLKQIKQPLLL